MTKKKKSKLPLVSVLVVTYNQQKYTKECLDSLRQQQYPNIEIIVVDNASKDGTQSFIQKSYPEIKLIQNKENQYFAEGNNIGYRNSKGKYIFLLNNDAYIEKNVISKLVAYLEDNPKVGIVQNKLLYADNPKKIDSAGSFFTFTGFLFHRGYQQHLVDNNISEVFSIKGASMMVKREIIDRIGLFDPNYKLYFEDTDLCWKSILLGYKVIYQPNSITYHHVGASSSKINLPFIDFHSFKNRILAIITNLHFSLLIIILPIHLILCIAISFIYLFKNYKNSLAILKAIVWNVKNINSTLKKRKKIQSTKQCSIKKILSLTKLPDPLYFIRFLYGYLYRKE